MKRITFASILSFALCAGSAFACNPYTSGSIGSCPIIIDDVKAAQVQLTAPFASSEQVALDASPKLPAAGFAFCEPPYVRIGNRCGIIIEPELKDLAFIPPDPVPYPECGGKGEPACPKLVEPASKVLAFIPPDPVPYPECGGKGEPACPKLVGRAVKVLAFIPPDPVPTPAPPKDPAV